MIKKSLLIIALVTVVMAQTTMCFKKEHLDPSTINSTALDGGDCKGIKSANDMKKDGFIIEDIKITSGNSGLNYIYIFKTASSIPQQVSSGVIVGNKVMTKAQLKAYLTEINKEEMAKKEKEKKEGSLELGKKIYTTTCFRCHGKKAEVKAYNSARPLKTLSVEQIKISLRDYESGDKDNGMAVIMRPYASKLDSNDILSVANYIQTLK
jgi:cytochrome c553